MSKTEGASQLGQNETSQVILSHLNHHPSKHVKSSMGLLMDLSARKICPELMAEDALVKAHQ